MLIHRSYRPLLMAICSAAALVSAAPAAADSARCRTEIVKASARYQQARLKALSQCRALVVKGALAPVTDCAAEPKTVAKLAKAAGKLAGSIAKACGGADRTCGSGADDDALADIGWDVSSCPDVGSAGCTNAIGDCGDVATCIGCLAESTTDELISLAYDRLDLASPAASALEECQSAIGKAATKFARSELKALGRCWTKVESGSIAGPCPTPGDGKTASVVSKARTKLVASVCKACGGADKLCDASVAGVLGSGAGDDLTPLAIGFAANCPHRTPPDAGQTCADPVDSLGALVGCVACTADFHAQCVDRSSVPWATSYPHDCSSLVLAESFNGSDGEAWPAPWTPIGGVDTADLLAGRGRFRPTISGYSLARLAAAVDEQDVDLVFTAEFSDETSQGIGFYVRQNGGYLQQTTPHGQGYAVFVEKFRPNGAEEPGIGLWYEEDGNEIDLQIQYGLVPITAGVRNRIRFRVSQSGPTQTLLRAKMWNELDAEPAAWMAETVDANPLLQQIGGGLVVDAWSDHTNVLDPASDMFLDDVEVRRLENPLSGIGPITAVDETLLFGEGPRWRAADGVLLFSDIDADTIYRLTPPSTVDVERSPSGQANGLAIDLDGGLLAAEHAGRRISRTDGGGVVTTVVDNYGGAAFNSPNDVAVRSDGTIYFTDPPFGLANPGDREIAFNGLFRLSPGGLPIAEWEGAVGVNTPNGVDLSPDQSVLYASDTTAGAVRVWQVAADGSLSGPQPFASGLIIPDGMCVDAAGNVYVATWASTVEIYAPSGDRWGALSLPGPATNCGFGGADLRTLYVTTQTGLYAFATTIPGIL